MKTAISGRKSDGIVVNLHKTVDLKLWIMLFLSLLYKRYSSMLTF